MHNLRRFYYQNKQKVWKVAIIVALILALIYFLNYTTTQRITDNNSQKVTHNREVYEDTENNIYISDKSAVTGEKINKDQAQQINNTISKFLQHCKNRNTEEAYKMISSDCKEKKYQTLEKFKNKYAEAKFSMNDIYEIEEWIGNTYRVSISEDMIATGKVGNNEKVVEYITIVKENAQDKLNISSYVGQRELNKKITQNNVKITAINKEIYMDYEIYNFKIENLSTNTIKLDAFEKTDSIYLEDSRGYDYPAYSHEILEDELIILPKRTFEISIKFSNPYSLSRDMRTIVFSNFIFDYEKYEEEKDREDLSKITINI